MLIYSEAGKAKWVKLGDAPHLFGQRSRNGPSRQRRCLRRELSCDNAKAEEAFSTIVDLAEEKNEKSTHNRDLETSTNLILLVLVSYILHVL